MYKKGASSPGGNADRQSYPDHVNPAKSMRLEKQHDAHETGSVGNLPGISNAGRDK